MVLLDVVLVLGSVFENAGELGIVEVSFLVNGGFSEQLVHFLICESIPHSGQQLSQVIFMNHTCRENVQVVLFVKSNNKSV